MFDYVTMTVGYQLFVITLILMTSVTILCDGSEDISVCTSYSRPPPELTIQCPQGMVVAGVDVFAGVHTTGVGSPDPCTYVEGDCTGRPISMTVEINHCLWKKSSCDFTAATTSSFMMPPCSGFAQYIMAGNKTCVDKSLVHDICDEFDISGSNGYIISPFYPWTYKPSSSSEGCSRRLVAPPGYGLALWSLTFDLEKDFAGQCKDWLTVSSPSMEEEIHCGKKEIKVDGKASEVTLTFYADGAGSNIGFLLEYRVYKLSNVPPRNVPTDGAPQITTSGGKGPEETMVIAPHTTSEEEEEEEVKGGEVSDMMIPILVLTIAIPLAIVLLVALVVIYICKRCRQPSNNSPLEQGEGGIMNSDKDPPSTILSCSNAINISDSYS